MNNLQIFEEKLSDNGCDCIVIALIAAVILLSVCCIMCQVISYLKYKQKQEERIETYILKDNQADEITKTLSTLTKEINEIKVLLNQQSVPNKRKCFLSRFWKILCVKRIK